MRDVRALIAVLAPGVSFVIGLFLLRDHARFLWLHDLGAAPLELWIIALAGTIGTAAGVQDWRYHRSRVQIGLPERRAHFAALSAGGVVFGLMCAASISSRPLIWLMPVLATAFGTSVLICYDELVFHRRRRCDRVETLLHRALVFGNTAAFFAWVHWCFVRTAGA
jgi:hypothetical protein